MCTDNDPECKTWAKAGECKTNANFMVGVFAGPLQPDGVVYASQQCMHPCSSVGADGAGGARSWVECLNCLHSWGMCIDLVIAFHPSPFDTYRILQSCICTQSSSIHALDLVRLLLLL
jgi:hypothetical protein